MLSYLKNLFLSEKKISTSDYLTILSMMLTLTLLSYFFSILNMQTTLLLTRKSIEDYASYLVLNNMIKFIFNTGSPWGLLVFLAAFLFVKRCYARLNLIVVLILALSITNFFNILPFIFYLFVDIGALLASKTHSSEVIETGIITFKLISLCFLVIGFTTLAYPFFKINDGFVVSSNKVSSTKQVGITREHFAITILIISMITLLLQNGLFLYYYHKDTEFLLDQKNWLPYVILIGIISVILTCYVFYLFWMRLRNAGKSTLLVLLPILFVLINALGYWLLGWLDSIILTLLSPWIIDIGSTLLCCYLCYLYLIPESEN